MKALSLIVACANNRVIGINNTLPWHLPEDLKRFRALTTGHHIIMGRKTYESLGRLLPNRTTVIVTRNPTYAVEGALMASSLEAAIALCKHDNEPFLIGGAELYQQGLVLATKLYVTQVQLEVQGDAFFPQLDVSCWQLVEKIERVSESGLRFADLIYVKQADFD
ncbi:MAG: dihydrofolate reductase [Methylophilaceae bacterium]